MTTGAVGILLASSIAAVAPTAMAQSLADAARQAEVHRAAAGTPAKKYTNADLAPVPNGPDQQSAETPAAPVEGGYMSASAGRLMSAEEITARSEAIIAKTKENLGEAQWRSRAANFRAQVEKARQQVGALSKPVAGDEREQARVAALLRKAGAALESALSQQEDFLAQADAAKVPKEWIK